MRRLREDKALHTQVSYLESSFYSLYMMRQLKLQRRASLVEEGVKHLQGLLGL